MSTFHRESALLLPVQGSFRQLGYGHTRPEVQFYEYRIDLYGYSLSQSSTFAVELKLDNWKRAIQQAVIYQLCADFCYLALPMKSASRVDLQVLRRYRLGLIGVVSAACCTTILQPRQSRVVLPQYRNHYMQLMQEEH
jgi:hypothetical protein